MYVSVWLVLCKIEWLDGSVTELTYGREVASGEKRV